MHTSTPRRKESRKYAVLYYWKGWFYCALHVAASVYTVVLCLCKSFTQATYSMYMYMYIYYTLYVHIYSIEHVLCTCILYILIPYMYIHVLCILFTLVSNWFTFRYIHVHLEYCLQTYTCIFLVLN